MSAQVDGKALDAVISAVSEGLGLRRAPKVVEDVGALPALDMPRPELVLRSGRSLILVQLRHRASHDDLARALLMGRLMTADGTPAGEVRLVLLAKVVPEDVRTAAERVGVRVLQLDWGVGIQNAPSRRRYSPAKLSNETSWRIIVELLRSGPSSIRRVARGARASYGWAHSTVMRLIEMGVAERSSRGVAINDVQRLLNGIAWERPLRDLQAATFRVHGAEVMQAARSIQSTASRQGIVLAYAGPTAAGIYTGHGQRFDSVYLYVGRDAVDLMRNVLEDPDGTLSVVALHPDREVFRVVEERQGLRLVEPSQALLDVAGLGYGHWDLTEKMVSYVEKTNR